MNEINNQTFLTKYDKWVYYLNMKNYTQMANPVRDSLAELLYNKNIIEFDTKNKLHLKWDDYIHEEIERQLYERNMIDYETDTYLFAKHLHFIDTDKKRELHNKIRYEIFERRLPYMNYTKEETDTDTDNEDL